MLPEPADPRSWDDAEGHDKGEDAEGEDGADDEVLTRRHNGPMVPSAPWLVFRRCSWGR